MRPARTASRAIVAGALSLLPASSPPAPGVARVAVPPGVAAPSTHGARVDRASAEEGVARLCAGEADVAIGPRPMTLAERAACARAGHAAFDLPIGYAASVAVDRAEDARIDAIAGAPVAAATIQRRARRDLARIVYAHVAVASAARPEVGALLAGMVDAPPGLVPLSDEARAFAHAGLASRAR